MNHAIYIKFDGSRETKILKPSLQEAQAFVGGYVEMVHPRGEPNCQMLVNEDGHAHGLPLNAFATEIYQAKNSIGEKIIASLGVGGPGLTSRLFESIDTTLPGIVGNVILLYGRTKWN